MRTNKKLMDWLNITNEKLASKFDENPIELNLLKVYFESDKEVMLLAFAQSIIRKHDDKLIA